MHLSFCSGSSPAGSSRVMKNSNEMISLFLFYNSKLWTTCIFTPFIIFNSRTWPIPIRKILEVPAPAKCNPKTSTSKATECTSAVPAKISWPPPKISVKNSNFFVKYAGARRSTSPNSKTNSASSTTRSWSRGKRSQWRMSSFATIQQWWRWT